jgi:hypothetical protein
VARCPSSVARAEPAARGRGSGRPPGVRTGRICTDCSRVQIGQFWTRRLWRQKLGIADGGHYRQRPDPTRPPASRTGGPRSIWAPRRAREVGAQFPDRQGQIAPSHACEYRPRPPESAGFRTSYTEPSLHATVAPCPSNTGTFACTVRVCSRADGQALRVAGPLKNWSPARSDPAASASCRSV